MRSPVLEFVDGRGPPVDRRAGARASTSLRRRRPLDPRARVRRLGAGRISRGRRPSSGTGATTRAAGRQPGLSGAPAPAASTASVQALLVGQSGPHHFSAVFTVAERGRRRSSIEVDVADRCRAPVEALASTYLVDARVRATWSTPSPTGIAWDLDARRPARASRPTRRRERRRWPRPAGGPRGSRRMAADRPGRSRPIGCVYRWRWTPCRDRWTCDRRRPRLADLVPDPPGDDRWTS